MSWFKKNPEVIQTESVAIGATTNASDTAAPEAIQKTEEPKKQRPLAHRVLNHLLGRYLGTALYIPYLAIKAVTVSPTTKPVSMIWNGVANKKAATKWAARLLVAVPAAVAIPGVVQPLAYRAAFIAATNKTYDCTVTGVETKVYPYSNLQEFAIFPAGFVTGFRDSWINSALPVMTRPVNGSVSKTLVFAMCAEKGTDDVKAQTFEVTDTWFRMENKFRSNDIGTGLRAAINKPHTEINASGLRYGPQSWTQNVLKYTAQ